MFNSWLEGQLAEEKARSAQPAILKAVDDEKPRHAGHVDRVRADIEWSEATRTATIKFVCEVCNTTRVVAVDPVGVVRLREERRTRPILFMPQPEIVQLGNGTVELGKGRVPVVERPPVIDMRRAPPAEEV